MHPRINDSNDAFLATGEGTGKEVLLFKVGIEPTAFVAAVGFGSSFKKVFRPHCGLLVVQWWEHPTGETQVVCSTAT